MHDARLMLLDRKPVSLLVHARMRCLRSAEAGLPGAELPPCPSSIPCPGVVQVELRVLEHLLQHDPEDGHNVVHIQEHFLFRCAQTPHATPTCLQHACMHASSHGSSGLLHPSKATLAAAATPAAPTPTPTPPVCCACRSHLCITFELLSINLYEFIKQNNFAGLSLGLIRRFGFQILQSLKCVG